MSALARVLSKAGLTGLDGPCVGTYKSLLSVNTVSFTTIHPSIVGLVLLGAVVVAGGAVLVEVRVVGRVRPVGAVTCPPLSAFVGPCFT
jgi:hypothetical protein